MPAKKKKAPAARKCTPAARKRTPAARKRTPAARKRTPAVSDQVQQPPAASQRSSDPRTLARKTVRCSLPNRSGKWTVEEDEGGKVVCISRRVPALKTWVDRTTLTVIA